MPSKLVEVRFGDEPDEFLSISVRGRAYRPSRDYWDGNWLFVTAIVRVGKFSGEVSGLLRAEELQLFNQKLREMQQSMTGAVTFETMEEWLTLRVEPDRLGNIKLSGKVSDDISNENYLTFVISTDQSFLAATLKQLQQVVELFPVVGRH